MLGSGERENGLAQYDLTEVSLAQVVDDARSLSLFAAQRVILVSNAEAALPRTKSGEEDDAEGPAAGGTGDLAAYLKDPSPGVVLLLEATRFEFAGDEKKKLERVRKFAIANGGPDLDPNTRQLLAALAGLTAARTALRKLAGIL